MLEIVQSDALTLLAGLEDSSVQLIVTDPPFGTGTTQSLASTGRHYVDPNVAEVVSLIGAVGVQARRVLAPDGVLAVLLDYRAVHQAYSALSANLVPHGEIVWWFETGGITKKWWANKHNTILLFGKSAQRPKFNFSEVPVTERKAPKEGYPASKPVNSVWNINVSSTDPQRVGYPSQKPVELYRRLVVAHSDVGNLVVDPFAGSGTLGAAADGRRCVLGDLSAVAVETMRRRFDLL